MRGIRKETAGPQLVSETAPEPVAGIYMRGGKRYVDFLAALLGLVLLAVPLALLALLVWLTSGRPVLFVQARVGRHGRLFSVRKFRTMTVRPPGDSSVTVGRDSRLTRIGGILRRWKLDELPQLWNVLVGDMSLVGPRPDVPGYADRLQGDHRRILELRPGITGPATLAYRDEEETLAQVVDPVRYSDEVIWPDKVRLNLEYFETCSFGTDLRIIWQTIFG